MEYKGTLDVSDEELNVLYNQVNKFCLAAHFLWTVWALIQTEHSYIDYDFIS
jgi:ethanolamine kinase